MLADAIRRGTARKAELPREAGGLLKAQEAARLLGTTVHVLSARQSLIAVQMDNGVIGFPAFQFENEIMRVGVAAVLDAINVDDPWMRLNFFFMHLDELDGRRPIDSIRDRLINAVILAAGHYGDHGAS